MLVWGYFFYKLAAAADITTNYNNIVVNWQWMEKEDGTINACPECGHYRSKNKMMITTSSGSVDYDLLFLYLSKRKKSFLQLQLHSTFFLSSLSSLFCLKFFFFSLSHPIFFMHASMIDWLSAKARVKVVCRIQMLEHSRI